MKNIPFNSSYTNTFLDTCNNLIKYEWKKDFINKIIPEYLNEPYIYFEDKYTEKERKSKYIKIKEKCPDNYIPIILQPSKNISSSQPDTTFTFSKKNFLFKREMTISDFLCILKTKTPVTKTIFLKAYNKDNMPFIIHDTSLTLDYIYEIYKSNDNFLYIYFIEEDCFG